MKCSVCSADNLEGSAYCEDCGAKLSSAPASVSVPPPSAPQAAPQAQPAPAAGAVGLVKCPSCSADNPAGTPYCDDCGASLMAAAPSKGEAAPSGPVSAPPKAEAKLVVDASGKELEIIKDLVTIGRKSPADGIFPDLDLTEDDPDAYVSRRHAQIVKKDDQYLFEDTGSSNGSFINNTKIAKGVQQALNDNDKLKLGKTTMVFKKI